MIDIPTSIIGNDIRAKSLKEFNEGREETPGRRVSTVSLLKVEDFNLEHPVSEVLSFCSFLQSNMSFLYWVDLFLERFHTLQCWKEREGLSLFREDSSGPFIDSREDVYD